MRPATSPRLPQAWPRWPTCVMLTLAVLSAHLALLAGGLPNWSAHTPAPSAPGLTNPGAAPTQSSAPDVAPPRPLAVLTSQVRWITPQAAPLTVPTRPEPPAVRVPSEPKPRPLPLPSESAPQVASVADTPIPEPLPETVAPKIEPSPDAYAVAVAVPVQDRDAAPATTNEAPDTADSAIQLAQATGQRDPARASASEAGKAGTRPLLAQPPASAQLSYNVEGKSKDLNYNATGSLDWRNEGRAYSARMEIRVFLLGSRVQTSQGELAVTGLQPERFADKRRSERAAHFDRIENRIRFSNNAMDAELLPGAQDRLSVFLQLAGLLNARPEAFSTGQTIDIPVAGTSDSETWRFQVQELTPLELPAGNLIARHLVREPRQPRDTRVDIWLAPSLGHLPVRIRLTQDSGDVVDQQLRILP